MEWQYSDDCDFNDEDEAALKELEKQAKITLAEWNLTVNQSKTEYVKFYVAAKKEKDHNNKTLHKDEPWRSNKLLGSLLCSKNTFLAVVSRVKLHSESLNKYGSPVRR